jgi:hypothetical protein
MATFNVLLSLLILLLAANMSSGGPVLCSYCQIAIGAVEKDLSDGHITEPQAIDKLKALCTSLPTPGEVFLCKAAVATKGPHYINELINGEPPLKFCGEIGFCNVTEPPPSSTPVAPPTNETKACSACQTVVGIIEDDLKTTNVSVAAIVERLDALCEQHLAPSLLEVRLCKSAVGIVVPRFVKQLQDGEEPLQVCKEILVCRPVGAPPLPPLSNVTVCSACTYAVDVVQRKLIASGLSAQQVVDLLLPLCDQLPESDQRACRLGLKLVAPKLINQLIDGDEPAQVCKEILACRPPDAPPLPPLSNITQCSACSFVVADVQREMIASGLSSKEIVQRLLPLCDKLPDKDQGPCRLGLRFAAPKYIKELLNGVEPSIFCGQFNLCPHDAGVLAAAGIGRPTTVADDDCAMCDVLADFMSERLGASRSDGAPPPRVTAEQLRSLFPTMCIGVGMGSRFDEPYGHACSRFMERFSMMMIGGLRATKQPNELCAWLPLRCA